MSNPTRSRKTKRAQPRLLHAVVRAMAIELHTAALKEVRRREKKDDGIEGLYENGKPRIIYAMEGLAKHVIKKYRPNE